MDFKRQLFLSKLAMHQQNMDKKAINPIFSSIRISSDENSVRIFSTDGQRALEHTLAQRKEKCDFVLNGTLLYEILKKSKSETFSIHETYEAYKISIDQAEFKIAKQLNVKNNVTWSDEYEYNLTIDAFALSNALKLIKWSSSNDDSRPFLNGVSIKSNENKLDLCATDGLRLALQKINIPTKLSNEWILGKKSIADLIKILEESNTKVDIFFGKYIKVVIKKKDEEIVWQSLLIPGKFPDYTKVIPSSFASSLVIHAKDLSEVLERIMVTANQNQPTIALKLNQEQCKILAENSLASGEDNLPGKYTGSNMTLLINGRFLQEILSNLNEEIIFEINDPRSPLAIKTLKNNGSVFVIAPVKQN